MSQVFKATLILTFFFGINKLVALVRQGLIATQFGFSAQIDAFNIANNLPDLLFSLFSGGALALAFIPVFSEHLHKHGKTASWILFSKIANVLFLTTIIFAIVFAIFAEPIVTSPFGIAPGFSSDQQALVVKLMRIDLIAMVIFSLSGLIMATLQAHKHFLLPAIAPILYNVGIIFGAVILAPQQGLNLGFLTLPSFGLGIYGLVYGTILGALMHLLIQIPGIIMHKFTWTPQITVTDPGVRKLLRVMAPRIATVFLIQLTFIGRDNMASFLSEGSVTALTYAYFILQVPETLIGTAIATALLPTLSEMVAKNETKEFINSIRKAIQVMLATTVILSLVIGLLLPVLIDLVFNFETNNANLLVWTTWGYLAGLTAHCLMEVLTRAFYARQNAVSPFIATLVRTVLFFVLAVLLVKSTGAVGLALIDSITVGIEVLLLAILLYKMYPGMFSIKSTLVRTGLGSLVTVGIIVLVMMAPLPPILGVILALCVGGGAYLLFIREELKILIKL